MLPARSRRTLPFLLIRVFPAARSRWILCRLIQEFPRIRIGTGDRPAGADLVEWVLGRCEGEERERMETAFEHAAESALVWVRSGINAAMNSGNRK